PTIKLPPNGPAVSSGMCAKKEGGSSTIRVTQSEGTPTWTDNSSAPGMTISCMVSRDGMCSLLSCLTPSACLRALGCKSTEYPVYGRIRDATAHDAPDVSSDDPTDTPPDRAPSPWAYTNH